MGGPRKTKGTGRVFVVAHHTELDARAVRLTTKSGILNYEKLFRGRFSLVIMNRWVWKCAIEEFREWISPARFPNQTNLRMPWGTADKRRHRHSIIPRSSTKTVSDALRPQSAPILAWATPVLFRSSLAAPFDRILFQIRKPQRSRGSHQSPEQATNHMQSHLCCPSVLALLTFIASHVTRS